VLERWLQRQAAAEGERLDQLRQRLWQGTPWQRHDRVLVLGAESLLWALDPLELAPEGGVLMLLHDAATQARLEAQMQVLDGLRRPELLVVPAEQPAQLEAALAANGQPRFEWVAARQPWREQTLAQIHPWLTQLSPRISRRGGWRLLFSTPLLGPASAIAALDPPLPPAAAQLLPSLLDAETQLLRKQQERLAAIAAALDALGWQVEQRAWQESLHLELGEGLLQRWLAPSSSYRRQLGAAGAGLAAGGPPSAALRQLLAAALGQALPQRLDHRLLVARWAGAPATKSPG
jgi:putative ATPase